MTDVIALIRQLVRAELSALPSSAIGVVESVPAHAEGDTANYQCDVRLRGREILLAGVPLISSHLGSVAPPNPGDLVLVHWVEHNQSQPVILGRFYSDALRAPVYAQNEWHTLLPPDAGESDRIAVTAVGGGQGSRSFALKLAPDVAITVTDTTVSVAASKLSFVLDAEGGEAVLRSQGATITVKDGGDLLVEAGGNLTLSAKGNVELSAGGNLKLSASANAELKGAMVSLGS